MISMHDKTQNETNSPFQYSNPTEKETETSEPSSLRGFASLYELCMICPGFVQDGQFFAAKDYLGKFLTNGLDFFVYRGYHPDYIVVLIRTPLQKLRNFAAETNCKMLLDEVKVKESLEAGNSEKNIRKIRIPDKRSEGFHFSKLYSPYKNIYGSFSQKVSEDLYFREKDQETPFSEILRIKLTSILVESRPRPHERVSENGEVTLETEENLKTKRYISTGALLGFFPLHDVKKRMELEEVWLGGSVVLPWKQPFHEIKDYFGEKICLYFVFLGHYTTWLSGPAIVGAALQVAVFIINDFSAMFLPVYSYFIALWAILMLQFWKRREVVTALEWGMTDFKTLQTDQPEFKGTPIYSYIDGAPMLYYSSLLHGLKAAGGLVATVLLLLAVMGLVSSIYVIRFSLQPFLGRDAQIVASAINFVQVQVSNQIYRFVAIALTNNENYRTETLYEDALIAKTFLFQFINSFASFFYLAFFAELVGDCRVTTAGGGCMEPLAINLGVMFGAQVLTSNFLSLVAPILRHYIVFHSLWCPRCLTEWTKQLFGDNRFVVAELTKSSAGGLDVLTRAEKEFLLEPFDAEEHSVAKYASLALRFGYSTMFVAALPVASLFSLASNIVENSLDAWKLLRIYRRPNPKGAENIGTWQSIFQLIAMVSVVTNASLTVFTMSVLRGYSQYLRFWIYVGFQWSCFIFQVLLIELIPNVPESVQIQIARTEFIVRKLIDQVADDEAVERNRRSAVDIVQHPTSDDNAAPLRFAVGRKNR